MYLFIHLFITVTSIMYYHYCMQGVDKLRFLYRGPLRQMFWGGPLICQGFTFCKSPPLGSPEAVHCPWLRLFRLSRLDPITFRHMGSMRPQKPWNLAKQHRSVGQNAPELHKQTLTHSLASLALKNALAGQIFTNKQTHNLSYTNKHKSLYTTTIKC